MISVPNLWFNLAQSEAAFYWRLCSGQRPLDLRELGGRTILLYFMLLQYRRAPHLRPRPTHHHGEKAEDPQRSVYGFISIPYGVLFDLVEHPYFQRLRNIKQVSLTHYVYPGALHTRFHHALGGSAPDAAGGDESARKGSNDR